MQKIVIITGFTGSGKSGLAVEIAKKFNGEIVSCDSVQVYKGLDIGSAKVTKQEMDGIKHHLIDIIEPFENYSVGQFVIDAKNCIGDIISRNKLPILVGGTGLYIKALLQGYDFSATARDDEFRAKYTELAKLNGNQYVWNELNKIAPDKAQTVHPNNLKRVIRYLEVAMSGNISSTTESILKDYSTLSIGIVGDRQMIYDRINRRVDIMLQDGLEQEVKGLIDTGLNLNNNCMTSIGYREMYQYLTGEIPYDKCVELIKQHTRNYCKRQLTFMKTMPQLELLDISQAKQKIEEFLNDKSK